VHDLRNDPNVTFVTISDSHGVMQEIDVRTPLALDPRELRTVPMPDLRSPIARTLDAQRRNLEHIDTRTADERVTAEFVRLVDCLQVLTLKVEALEEQQPALEYVARHLERLERHVKLTQPPDMAEHTYTEQVDYWNSVQHLAAQRLGALSAAGVTP
jgi:hypothetical protein